MKNLKDPHCCCELATPEMMRAELRDSSWDAGLYHPGNLSVVFAKSFMMRGLVHEYDPVDKCCERPLSHVHVHVRHWQRKGNGGGSARETAVAAQGKRLWQRKENICGSWRQVFADRRRRVRVPWWRRSWGGWPERLCPA